MSDIRSILTEAQERTIIESIRTAEKNTSGEIRVHMEDHCSGELMDRATEIFEHLDIQKTKDRNGVLLYFAVKDHKVAILGDKGINAVVEEDFWDDKLKRIVEYFKQGAFQAGICHTVEEVGLKLKKHFPIKGDDKNELPDEISYEK